MKGINALLNVGNRAAILAAALTVICICAKAKCDADTVRQHDCHRASGSIQIDGKLDDASWKKAGVIEFVIPVTSKMPMSKTEAKVLWDDSYLYVAYRAYDKDVWSLLKDRDDQTCMEDCLECFIQPNPTRQTYYDFEINAIGTIYDSCNIGRNSGGYDHHRWAAWNCKGLGVGIFMDGMLNDPSDVDHYWQMELAIPFSELPSLKGNKPKVGDRWRFLLARYDFSVYIPEGAELSSCANLKAVDFHAARDWPQLKFVE